MSTLNRIVCPLRPTVTGHHLLTNVSEMYCDHYWLTCRLHVQYRCEVKVLNWKMTWKMTYRNEISSKSPKNQFQTSKVNIIFLCKTYDTILDKDSKRKIPKCDQSPKRRKNKNSCRDSTQVRQLT